MTFIFNFDAGDAFVENDASLTSICEKKVLGGADEPASKVGLAISSIQSITTSQDLAHPFRSRSILMTSPCVSSSARKVLIVISNSLILASRAVNPFLRRSRLELLC